MKKLRLDVDRVAVESFPTAEGGAQVRDLFAATRPEACDPFTLPPRCS